MLTVPQQDYADLKEGGNPSHLLLQKVTESERMMTPFQDGALR